jgi:uncharacterized protein
MSSVSSKATPTLDALRRYAIARSLGKPTTLAKAVQRAGFVQADPIRAPARAQDLTLRHRVAGYTAGELDARYAKLPIEEDFFVNYGYLPRDLAALMHPRTPRTVWTAARWAQAHAVLEFVRDKGVAHPRDVNAAFDHGRSKNWFGGTSRASTQLLDGMHYRGLVRTAGREGGIRLYAARPAHEPVDNVDAALDRLADVVVGLYAPLPMGTFLMLHRRLAVGVPQWRERIGALIRRSQARLPNAQVEGQRWFWPAGDNPSSRRHAAVDEGDTMRLLAPFDPIVWDRRRFETFWGWAYRFEAYTPAPQRVRGYYALPMLWRGQVLGWANASTTSGRLVLQPGYVAGRAPREAAFKGALRDETARLSAFLGL